MRDFLRCTTDHGRAIIEERFMPASQQPVPTELRLTDRAGVVSEVYVRSNIWFRIISDRHGVFNGSDEYAMKAAGAYVRTAREYMKAHVPGLVVPFVAAVDFRGFRCLAVAGLPLGLSSGGSVGLLQDFAALEAAAAAGGGLGMGAGKPKASDPSEGRGGAAFLPGAPGASDLERGTSAADRLVVGTLNRGKTIVASDTGALDKMRSAAKTINLAAHSVRGAEDVSSKTLTSAADVRVYRSARGGDSASSDSSQVEHCVLGFHRGLPPEDPSATKFLAPVPRGMSIFWRYTTARWSCIQRFWVA